MTILRLGPEITERELFDEATPDEYLLDLIDDYGCLENALSSAVEARKAAEVLVKENAPAPRKELIVRFHCRSPGGARVEGVRVKTRAEIEAAHELDVHNGWDQFPQNIKRYRHDIAEIEAHETSCLMVEVEYGLPALEEEEECRLEEMRAQLEAIGATRAHTLHGVQRKHRLAALQPDLITSVLADLDSMTGTM